MNKTIPQLVTELRRSLNGINQEQLAERLGVTQPTVSRWERGLAQPDGEQLAALAKLDPTNSAAVWLGLNETPADQENGKPGSHSQRMIAPETKTGLGFSSGAQTYSSWPKDLKIIGHVKAGVEGLFLDQGEHHGMAHRPPALSTVKDAFAVYVQDESMVPAFEPGHVVWVHPTRPVAPGCNVVIELDDGQAFIKRLVRRTASKIVCLQWQPKKEIEYEAKRVKRLYFVVGSYKED